MRTTLRYFALLATIASASSFALAQDDATQAGRRQAEQSPLSTQSQTQSRAAAEQPGQPGQPRPGGLIQPGQPQPGQPGAQPAMQGAGMSVSQFLAHDLRRGNEAEVELGKLASEKAQHDQVKKFAQTMVEHHQQFIQQLQQAEQRGGAAGQGAARAGAPRTRVGQSEPDSRDDSVRDDREIQDQADRPAQGNIRRGTGNVRNSESGTDGVRSPQGAAAPGGSSQATTTAGQAPGSNEPGTPPALAGQAVPGQASAAGRPIPGQPGIAGGPMMSGQVPQQLVAVFDQASDTELQMTKEMLQQHQGQDFDMGYIGQQIVAHTCMLAKLQAIKNSGPQDLQQLATQGEQTTRQHLDMAKQIAQQIKDKGESGSQPATRSASSSAKEPSTTERENK